MTRDDLIAQSLKDKAAIDALPPAKRRQLDLEMAALNRRLKQVQAECEAARSSSQ